MIQQFAILTSDIGSVLLLINALLFAVRKKKMPLSVQHMGWFLLLCVITEAAAQSLFYLKINNLFLLHIYTLLEWIAWSYFYYFLFQNKPRLKKALPYFTIVLSVLIILNTLFLEHFTSFNGNAKTAVQLCLIAYAVYYFFTAFGKIDLNKSEPRALTFINFAVILYYSGSLFIFMVPKLLQSMGYCQCADQWPLGSQCLIVTGFL